MSIETVNGLIGLITIEPSRRHEPNCGPLAECDATVGQVLICLSGGEPAFEWPEEWPVEQSSCLVLEEIEPSASHLAASRFTIAGLPCESATLQANLQNLAVELNQALQLVRRKIAAASLAGT